MARSRCSAEFTRLVTKPLNYFFLIFTNYLFYIASNAGLQSDKDYIIGADSVLQDSEDLFSLIEAHEQKPLKLFVYNITTDSCREVTIVPNSTWGGEGSLGCGIGYGKII